MPEFQFGRFYEDFTVGERIKHAKRKTIFESDNNFFSLLTMNHHPLHLDVEYSEKSQHGKILVIGTLIFSVAVGLTVEDISGKAIANLEYEKVQHNAPVFINDTIKAETIILEKKESKSRNDRGIVYVETKVFNQYEHLVLTFRRKVLVPKKGA